jgi:hypothetical protein
VAVPLDEAVALLTALLEEEKASTRPLTFGDAIGFVLGWYAEEHGYGDQLDLPPRQLVEHLQGALQPSVMGHTDDYSAGQGTSQGRAAFQRIPEGHNASRAEARALELLAAGYSERRLLAALKEEGLKLNKNRLAGLRRLLRQKP